MKKILAALIFLVIGTVSCSSCTPSENQIDATSPAECSINGCQLDSGTDVLNDIVDDANPNTVVSGDTWEFAVPPGWIEMEVTETEITALYGNKEKKNLIFLVKETYPGNNEEYALTAIRGLKEAGSSTTSTKQVVLNGVKFVLVETTKQNVKMWLWATTKSGFGYGLSCGGLSENYDFNHAICFAVADSLKLK